VAGVRRPATPGRFSVLIAASLYTRQIQNLGAPMAFIEAAGRQKPIMKANPKFESRPDTRALLKSAAREALDIADDVLRGNLARQSTAPIR
jgi:hypothetical protein